jgi:hypothetical protein
MSGTQTKTEGGMSKETQALEIIRNTHGKQTDGLNVEQFRAICDAVTLYAIAFDAETTARLVCEEVVA